MPHRVYRSSYPSPNIPLDISVSQLLQIYNPDDVAADKIVCDDDWTHTTLTYSALREDASVIAYGFRHVMGLSEGEVVSICAPNSVDVIRLIHAVLWCGGIAVLINPLSTEHEIAHYLQISRPSLLASDSSTLAKLEAAAHKQNLSNVKWLLLEKARSVRPCTTLSDLLVGSHKLPVFDLSNRDNREHAAVVCFSSGTSGKAKGVELSHHNLVAAMLSCRATDPIYWNANIRSVFFAPLCHIYGLMTVALMGCWLGAHNKLMKKYTLGSFLEHSASIKATALRILPTIAVSMVKQQDFDLKRLSSVNTIMCSGAALPKSIIQTFLEKFPRAPITQGYGMTEANITFLKAESAAHVGSVGKLFAGVEARIIDDEGRDVDQGEQGEILIQGANVFRRYVRNEKATRETFDGEWMKTGDVGKVNRDGYFYLTERKKELIKYKGNQVAPAELEAILNSHPSVGEGAVCALWNEDQGTEMPIAYVCLRQGVEQQNRDLETTLAGIRQYVDSKVATYKRLRGGVVVLDEIPKSSNGKVLRRMLPARLARERAAKL